MNIPRGMLVIWAGRRILMLVFAEETVLLTSPCPPFLPLGSLPRVSHEGKHRAKASKSRGEP